MHFSVPTPVGPQTLCDVKGWRVIGIESKEVSNLSLSQVQDEMRSVGRPITMHFSAMPSVYDVEELKEQLSGDSLTNHLSPLAITTDLSALTGLEQRVKAAPQGSSDRARLEVEHGNLAAAYERAVELCKAEKAMGIPIVVSLNEPKPTEEQKAGSTPVPSQEATAEPTSQRIEVVEANGLPPEWDMGYMDTPEVETNGEAALELAGLKPAQDQATPVPTMGEGSRACGGCCGPSMPFGF